MTNKILNQQNCKPVKSRRSDTSEMSGMIIQQTENVINSTPITQCKQRNVGIKFQGLINPGN